MYKFGKASSKQLATCDLDIQKVLERAILIIDFSVICGFRNEEDQNKAVHDGFSKVLFPHSKHNRFPSQAVDIVPYPIDWKDTGRFLFLQGIILGIASEMKIPIRLGIDWNGDGDIRDQSFMDYPHLELIRDVD